MNESAKFDKKEDKMQKPRHRSTDEQQLDGKGEEMPRQVLAAEPEDHSQQMPDGSHHDHAWWGPVGKPTERGGIIMSDDAGHQSDDEGYNNLPHDFAEK